MASEMRLQSQRSHIATGAADERASPASEPSGHAGGQADWRVPPDSTRATRAARRGQSRAARHQGCPPDSCPRTWRESGKSICRPLPPRSHGRCLSKNRRRYSAGVKIVHLIKSLVGVSSGRCFTVQTLVLEAKIGE